MPKNDLGMACRVCGVVDEQPGEDVLEPDAYDLEWVHLACLYARRRADSLASQYA